MSFHVETARTEDHDARPSFVAQMTGISPTTLGKAVDAGFVPRLTHRNVLDIAALPMLTSVQAADGTPIPVLRMGGQARSCGDDGGHVPARQFSGVGAGMSDDEFTAATLRWWKESGRQRVLAAGYLLVAIGGLTVGLLRVTDFRRHNGRIEYIGSLVARTDDVLTRTIRIVDRDADDDVREFAQEVLATRSTTRGGGVIGILDDDLDNENVVEG